MVVLTEDMIVARTRVTDMNHVKKLNCWGAELSDISVLRKLSNVEVLSLRYYSLLLIHYSSSIASYSSFIIYIIS